jgi:nitrate/TMAO reductase-like tetraheme cytochrome c subunit
MLSPITMKTTNNKAHNSSVFFDKIKSLHYILLYSVTDLTETQFATGYVEHNYNLMHILNKGNVSEQHTQCKMMNPQILSQYGSTYHNQADSGILIIDVTLHTLWSQ